MPEVLLLGGLLAGRMVQWVSEPREAVGKRRKRVEEGEMERATERERERERKSTEEQGIDKEKCESH